ncbi:hypothetical protein BV898_06004 [Hypsibius exemplaris]|uniref:PiggyBac transposable element-derived protein domain-containing protein n=1 Tax=Hypsibius exemplaris TaxID=2072580 RepID=A0A1W0WXR4_HYPEX|nr:hypothetical protein BV898_06004 [Hypsibius exemplaris]
MPGHARVLRAAFCAEGLKFSEDFLDFVAQFGSGKMGSEARFAIYQAMSFKILGRGTKIVLIYPDSMLAYVRHMYGGTVTSGSGRGTLKISLSQLSTVDSTVDCGLSTPWLSSFPTPDATLSVADLRSNADGRSTYNAVMSRTRFVQINCSLRFDDKSMRADCLKKDRIPHIRELLDFWTPTLRLSFLPYENMTVDEQLFPFRGRCAHKQYIPTTPRGKFGLKMWFLACAVTCYCCNFEPYVGKVPGVWQKRSEECALFCV